MENKIKNKKQKPKTADGLNQNKIYINNIIKQVKQNKIKVNNMTNSNKQNNNNKRIAPIKKNERILSDKNNHKFISNKIKNDKIIKNNKIQKGNQNRSKSLNLIQRSHKNVNHPNKNPIINNINLNINIRQSSSKKKYSDKGKAHHINSIQFPKKINLDLNSPRNKSMNKITNNNKHQKSNTSYNAFKDRAKSINKISRTEEKNGMKKNSQSKDIKKAQLFSPLQKNSKNNINSSQRNKVSKPNNFPISVKFMQHQSLQNNNKKVFRPKTKLDYRKNLSIENKAKKPKQITDKKQEKMMKELFGGKIFSMKKEKETNNKNKNINKNTNNQNKKEIKNKNIIPKQPNKQNQQIPKFIPTKIIPIQTYSKPTLIGLTNIGATCFINSTLQCLSQTEDLTNYFLNEKNKNKIINENNIALKNKNENQLSPAFHELINKLWEKNASNNKSFSPNHLVKIINEMNPLFKLGEAGDSKDFIIFILEQLHNELKKSFNDKKNTPDPLDQYNKDNTLQNFLYEFKSECSIISDVFFGIYETTNVCLNCKKNYNSKNLNNPICYNYGIFNCLIFPLEEVKNMKLKNNANQINNQIMENSNNVVNMNDCFDFYQKNELFTGDNKNYCNICQQLFDSIYTTKIYTSPNFLILILNRGKGKKYNVKLDFPEILNITQYVMVKEIPNIIYNLYGVVTHIGESGPNAHFVASCKSPVDGKWYRYNDAIVNSISDLKREVIDFGTPYILFYQKNK